MKIDLIHNKIFYLIILGLFLFMPNFVNASTDITYVSYTPGTITVVNGSGTQRGFTPSYNSGGTYRAAFSSNDFGSAVPIVRATMALNFSKTIDFSQYSYAVISFGIIPSAVQLDSTFGLCLPFSSSEISSTYLCPIYNNNSYSSVFFTAIFENTTSGSILYGNTMALIGKDATSNDVSSAINKQTTEITNSIDNIKDMDMSDSDKEMPDDSSYQDYSSTQDELLDKTKEADLDSLDVGLDVKSSSWVWDTLTSLIQSHSVVFGMVIAILSIGVIKLVLGR